MLIIRYIIECIHFLYKWFHPRYTLRRVRYGDIKLFYKLDTGEKRAEHFPYESAYNWNKLRRSLRILGYIPSIITYSYRDEEGISYRIANGNHRFTILCETSKKTDFIKIWVDGKRTKSYQGIIEGDRITKNKVEKELNKLIKEVDILKSKSRIYRKLKK